MRPSISRLTQAMSKSQLRLREGVDALPAVPRTLVTLYHLEELSITEIATITGMSEGTIKSHLFRARLSLRDWLRSTRRECTMKNPERSAALARALAAQTDGLPKEFAKQVAALAEAESRSSPLSWNDVGLIGAFVAMIGVCVAGWVTFGAKESGSAEWFDPVVGAVTSQPWLVIGVVGVVFVQLMTFRRRATA